MLQTTTKQSKRQSQEQEQRTNNAINNKIAIEHKRNLLDQGMGIRDWAMERRERDTDFGELERKKRERVGHMQTDRQSDRETAVPKGCVRSMLG